MAELSSAEQRRCDCNCYAKKWGAPARAEVEALLQLDKPLQLRAAGPREGLLVAVGCGDVVQ